MAIQYMKLAACSPNGFPIELRKCSHDGHDWYEVREWNGALDDDDPHVEEFDTLAEANVAYAFRRTALIDTPNPEAQARYDAEWGTDNGHPFRRQREC